MYAMWRIACRSIGSVNLHHTYLHLSSSVYIFRHNCLLTDLACLYMTCHHYNGHAARTVHVDIDSKTCRVYSSVGASTISAGNLFHVFAAPSRRKFFLTHWSGWILDLQSFGYVLWYHLVILPV